MKIIRQISDLISEEIEGAEEYAKAAIRSKDEYPVLAKVMYDISMDELRHVDMLHGEVVKIIESFRRENGNPPEAMLAVYEYLHEKQIEAVNKIKMYQSHFREGPAGHNRYDK